MLPVPRLPARSQCHHLWRLQLPPQDVVWQQSKPTSKTHLSGDSGLAEGLVDNLLRLSLKRRNRMGVYTHFPQNGSMLSIIDLAFTRGLPGISYWTLGDDFGLDHLSTHLHIRLNNTPGLPTPAWSKTGWSKFCKTVAETGLGFGTVISPREVERAAINYTAALQTAIDEVVPKVEPNKCRRIRGRWTRELDKLRINVAKNYSILIQSGLSRIYKTLWLLIEPQHHSLTAYQSSQSSKSESPGCGIHPW